jgi:hypothetical protein
VTFNSEAARQLYEDFATPAPEPTKLDKALREVQAAEDVRAVRRVVRTWATELDPRGNELVVLGSAAADCERDLLAAEFAEAD